MLSALGAKIIDEVKGIEILEHNTANFRNISVRCVRRREGVNVVDDRVIDK